MNNQQTIIVNYHPTRASGGRKGWAKCVTAVDPKRRNGYAFSGDFLHAGENELPVSATIIAKDPAGSVKNSFHVWRLGYVAADGAIEWDKREWEQSEFISFRNLVADRVAGKTVGEKQRANLLAERSRLEARIADIDAEILALRPGQ